MNKLMRAFAALCLFFGGVLLLTGSSVNPEAPTPVADSVVTDPGVLEEFGPPGVLITTVLTGVVMIFRAYNDGKKIDVTTYKERAEESENRANVEIGKVHTKLTELEIKLDEVIKDRDDYRSLLEDKKANFTQQILDLEKRHQVELEDMHAALLIELHLRHGLERLLAEHGITIPPGAATTE